MARLAGPLRRVSTTTSLPHGRPESRDRSAARLRAPELACRAHMLPGAPMGSDDPRYLCYLSGDSCRPLLAGLGPPDAARRDTLCCDSAACGASRHVGVAYSPRILIGTVNSSFIQ